MFKYGASRRLGGLVVKASKSSAGCPGIKCHQPIGRNLRGQAHVQWMTQSTLGYSVPTSSTVSRPGGHA